MNTANKYCISYYLCTRPLFGSRLALIVHGKWPSFQMLFDYITLFLWWQYNHDMFPGIFYHYQTNSSMAHWTILCILYGWFFFYLNKLDSLFSEMLLDIWLKSFKIYIELYEDIISQWNSFIFAALNIAELMT